MREMTPLIPISNFETYLQRVQQFPLLSQEEELALAQDWQENGNVQAAQQLVVAHLRYVARVARGFLGYGLNMNDLMQEGTIGLMKAVKKFNPDLGVRLVSFAVHWIKAEINEFVIKNWRIVKVATTKAQRKLFFNLRSQKKRLGWMSRQEVSDVAQDLGVPVAEVIRMEERLNAHDTALELPKSDSSQEPAFVLPIVAEGADPAEIVLQQNWESELSDKLQQAITGLDARDQYIIKRRWFDENKATLQELGIKFGISIERVRQLEKRAISFLRTQITDIH